MDQLDYERIVASHHENLYRFAFSLAGNADDAAELTQETYVRLLTKGGQLRDLDRVKTWLFTTLYRIFAGWKRHAARFQHLEIVSVEDELPAITPEIADEMDGDSVMETALELEEHFRAPLVLYYLQSLTYREIAQVLDVPIGTVMSRLSRGKDLLRNRMACRRARETTLEAKILSPEQFIRTQGQ